MIKREKRVIICTYNYFTSNYQVGSHHYARALEKLGYRVAFVSNPISPLHYLFARGDALQKRASIHKSGGVWEGNIWYYVPRAILTPQNRPLLSSRYIFENWYKFSQKSLLETLSESGFGDVDLLWIESPFFGFMLDMQKHERSILRVADFSKGFEKNWDLMYEKEIEISQKVDKVIYTAKRLKEHYSAIESSKMEYISNGIDLDMIKQSDKSLPKEFEEIPSPRVIYVGMVNYWFDVDLVYRSALRYPHYSFTIIGGVSIDISRLKELTNVYILGVKEHASVSQYLSHSDIGMIPFIRSDFVDSINPIKLYEYAAYGLRVVSTRWSELEGLEELFDICATDELFIEALSRGRVENSEEIEGWLLCQEWIQKAQKAISFETHI